MRSPLPFWRRTRRRALSAAAAVVMPGVIALTSSAVAPVDGWSWPLLPAPPPVAAVFVAPAGPYAPGHRGVDLRAGPGSLVLAAGTGTVAFAGRVAGRGVVSIDHPGGLRTTYEPVFALVSEGDPVSRGSPVGRLEVVGSHCLPDLCLHWGARRGETYLDPLGLLGVLVRVRLLPMWP